MVGMIAESVCTRRVVAVGTCLSEGTRVTSQPLRLGPWRNGEMTDRRRVERDYWWVA